MNGLRASRPGGEAGAQTGRSERSGTSFEKLVSLLEAEPLAEQTLLDVGTGTGRLALALAPRCRRVIGIDRDAAAIDEARTRADLAGVPNAEFLLADAEAVEYTRFAPDLVAAHLCVSDAIIARAARALAPGRVLAFVAFHEDHWRETGRRSRFAYDTAQVRRVLDAGGFTIERLDVDRHVQTFASVEEGLAAALSHREKWQTDDRWRTYVEFLQAGGRTLTRSNVVCFARRR